MVILTKSKENAILQSYKGRIKIYSRNLSYEIMMIVINFVCFDNRYINNDIPYAKINYVKNARVLRYNLSYGSSLRITIVKRGTRVMINPIQPLI